jgi:death-on-curing family protein
MVSSSNLKYILATVQDIGEELDDELEAMKRKAAYLIYNMVVSHPFLDGNKRSAFEVTKRFLELNNFILDPEEEETFCKLVSMAAGRFTQDDVESWIGRNLRKGRRRSN